MTGGAGHLGGSGAPPWGLPDARHLDGLSGAGSPVTGNMQCGSFPGPTAPAPGHTGTEVGGCLPPARVTSHRVRLQLLQPSCPLHLLTRPGHRVGYVWLSLMSPHRTSLTAPHKSTRWGDAPPLAPTALIWPQGNGASYPSSVMKSFLSRSQGRGSESGGRGTRSCFGLVIISLVTAHPPHLKTLGTAGDIRNSQQSTEGRGCSGAATGRCRIFLWRSRWLWSLIFGAGGG